MKKWFAMLAIAFALALAVVPSVGGDILPQIEHPFLE